MSGALKVARTVCDRCEDKESDGALSRWPTTRRTIGLRGYTGLSVERPAGAFARGMSTSGARSLSKGANAIRR